MSRVQFFRIFQSVAEQAGIPHDLRHPHTLKHALGFSMVREGVQTLATRACNPRLCTQVPTMPWPTRLDGRRSPTSS